LADVGVPSIDVQLRRRLGCTSAQTNPGLAARVPAVVWHHPSPVLGAMW